MMRSIAFGLAFLGWLAAQETLMVAHKQADSVGFYDAKSGKLLDTVPVGARPHEMTMARDGRHVFVTNYGVGSWTDTDPGTNTLSVIDVRARKEVGRVNLGTFRRPHGIEAGHQSGNLYMTVDLPPSVLVVDPVKRQVLRHFDVEGQKAPHMLAVSRDEKRIYVANSGSGTVTALSTDGSAKPVHVNVGGVPMGIVLEGNLCFVATRTTNQVVAIDTKTNKIAYRIDIAGQPARVRGYQGRYLIVTLIDSGETAIVDLKQRTEMLRLKSGRNSEGIQIERAGPHFYIAAQGDNKVIKYDSTTWKKLIEIPTAARPDPMILF